MSEHRANLSWKRLDASFEYEHYPRSHTWNIAGNQIPASAAPEFRGDADRVDPEAALVSALSSCHMLTFLAICARKGIIVNRYDDDAVGFLEKNELGKLAVTRVELRPRIVFENDALNPQDLQKLHQQAHRGCFIASSVKTQVEVVQDL